MARGNQRDKAREANLKRQAALKSGNTMSGAQMAKQKEAAGDIMRAKQLRNEERKREEAAAKEAAKLKAAEDAKKEKLKKERAAAAAAKKKASTPAADSQKAIARIAMPKVKKADKLMEEGKLAAAIPLYEEAVADFLSGGFKRPKLLEKIAECKAGMAATE